MFPNINFDDIINFSYKYNLNSLDNYGLLIILNNVMYLNNIKYVNIENLDLSNNSIKEKTIKLIKDCMFTYKKNQIVKIKEFINDNKNIIRRASRDFENFEYNMELSDIDEDFNIEEDCESEDSFSWTTDEENDNNSIETEDITLFINNINYNS